MAKEQVNIPNRIIKQYHSAYNIAAKCSNNIVEICENLYDILSSADINNDNDCKIRDDFLSGLDVCISDRKTTFELTNLTTDINFLLLYITIWMNSSKEFDIDINYISRRKSLEKDLSKMFERAFNGKDAQKVYDRFAFRGIVSNTISGYKTIGYVEELTNYILGILGNKNRKLKLEFENWISENPKITNFDKERIKYLLSLPFSFMELSITDTDTFDPKEHPTVIVPKKTKIQYDSLIKNYVSTPKKNGYQSIHFVLFLRKDSPILPGATIEGQIRDHYMDDYAENLEASHNEYSDKKYDVIKDIFTIDDFSKVNIVCFKDYKKVENDTDGLHYPKMFTARRINPSVRL